MRLSLPERAHELLSSHDVPLEIVTLSEPHAFPENELIVTGIAKRDGETLFVKNTKPDREWELPSGTVEDGESLEEAMHREFLEETGCPVEESEPVMVLVWAFPDSLLTQVIYHITCGPQEGETVDEIAETRWMDEIPADVSFGSISREAFEDLLELDNEDALSRLRDLLDGPIKSRKSLAAGAATGGLAVLALAHRYLPRKESPTEE
ncbi:NUDIX hydrolase [Haladaptatus sp. DYSN1]|uniref:NUDIX hydrolase n=1 Tax=unclassified Haladaptatus TaxID=2622732 RepID=UPI0024054144|nr:NUDIX hydrolase [Haladaptatus sp. DYSN1]